MLISLFFLLGLFLLHFDPSILALTWSDFGTWRFIVNLVTSMFSHANMQHLLGNYIFALPYALYLEHRVKEAGFAVCWVFCGLLAVAGEACVHYYNPAGPGVIGSSGAIFGVMTAAMFLVEGVVYKWVARLAALFQLVMQGIAAYAVAGGAYGFIAYGAHFGGGVAGIIFALAYVKCVKKPV